MTNGYDSTNENAHPDFAKNLPEAILGVQIGASQSLGVSLTQLRLSNPRSLLGEKLFAACLKKRVCRTASSNEHPFRTMIETPGCLLDRLHCKADSNTKSHPL